MDIVGSLFFSSVSEGFFHARVVSVAGVAVACKSAAAPAAVGGTRGASDGNLQPSTWRWRQKTEASSLTCPVVVSKKRRNKRVAAVETYKTVLLRQKTPPAVLTIRT